jgi:hypothetical protein
MMPCSRSCLNDLSDGFEKNEAENDEQHDEMNKVDMSGTLPSVIIAIASLN